jgi:hypothetical protein
MLARAYVPEVTSFPTTPFHGQVIDYVFDAVNGYDWRFRYNAATAKWRYIGGPPMFAEVTAQESTSSASYAALGTTGPAVITPRAGDYFVDQGAWFSSTGSNSEQMLMSYDIGGTGAVDADAVIAGTSAGGTIAQSASARRRFKASLAASTTLTSKYKIPAAAAGFFGNRWISLVPVRVS